MTLTLQDQSLWPGHDLPALPVAHARALALLFDGGVEVRAVADVVESDAALTVSVLRAANSAASAPARPVTALREAIVRVGLDATLRVVGGAIIHASFGDLRRSTLDVGEMWRHLIATALLADADAVSAGAQTVAFTAGLLHDVGRLSMAAQDPRRYAEVIRLARAGHAPVAAEIELFGFSHAQWGIHVAHAWGVPAPVMDAISEHHVETSESELAQAVHAARRVSAGLGIGDGVGPPPAAADPLEALPAQVDALGGLEALSLLIEWYSGAFRAAA